MVIIMEYILEYYYRIIIDNKKIDNNGYFSYNNHHFCLYKYERNIEEINDLVKLNYDLLNRGININRIINNIYDRPLSNYEGNNYVLLLIKYQYQKGIFKYILINSNEYKLLQRNNWGYLWSMKIDYIEYQIKHLVNKYPLLYKTVNYYIGLSENAIKYFNMLKLDNINLYISHRRINNDFLYNPVNLIIDYKVRDISEYLKMCFINKEKDIYEIKRYLINQSLSNIDYILLYVRMLYPSFYFDIYENIVNNSLDEKEILKVTDMVNKYEELLYEIYEIIKRKINVIGIDWINNKFKNM